MRQRALTLALGAAVGLFFSVALFAVAAVSPQGTVVVAFLSGLGTMTLLLWVGFGKAPFAPPSSLPDVACSFCGKSRQAVKHLVAAPRVSICDECTSLTLGVLLEQEAPNWQLVLAALPPRTPRDVSSALINLVAVSSEPAELRRFMLEAHRVGNPVAQVALFERIAEDARTSADWINYGVCLGELGRYAEAIAATRRSGGLEVWVLNNVNAFTVQAEPSRREGLPELLEEQRRALQGVEAIDEKQRPTVRAAMLGTVAEVQRRLGALDEALKSLEEAETLWPGSHERAVTKAKVLVDQGKAAEAKVLLEQVSAKGHPEALVTLEAKRLLSAP